MMNKNHIKETKELERFRRDTLKEINSLIGHLKYLIILENSKEKE